MDLKLFGPQCRGWLFPLSIAALLCVLFAPHPGYAEGQNARQAFSISTSASAGVFFGQAVEDIYNQFLSKDYKNSELVWPFTPLYYSGAGLSLVTRMGFFADLDVRQGFAGKTGSMTDSDFLNGDAVRTHFSQSDSYTERALLLDLKAGYDFPMRGPLGLGFFGGLSYMDFKWSARDGYYQYPTSGSDYYWDSSGVFHDRLAVQAGAAGGELTLQLPAEALDQREAFVREIGQHLLLLLGQRDELSLLGVRQDE